MSVPLLVVRRANVQTVELDGDISLYDPTSNNAVSLNATASAIWTLLDGESRCEEVIAALAERFDVDEKDIADDVVRTIAELRSLGLVADVTAESPAHGS